MKSNPIMQGHWELMKQLLQNEQIRGVIADLNELSKIELEMYGISSYMKQFVIAHDPGVLPPHV